MVAALTSEDAASRWIAPSVVVWLWYAVAELTLAVAQEYAHLPDGAHVFDWRLELCVLGAYAVIGAALGASLALVFRRTQRDPASRRALIAFPLIAALAAQLAGSSLASAAGTAALAAAAAIAIAGRLPGALAGWLHPLCIAGVALAPQIAERLAPGSRLRPAITIALAVTALAAAVIAARVRAPRALRLAALPAGALAALALAQRVSPPVPAAGHGDGMNLVLVVLDTTRADHLSLYGYERDTTPQLERLAAESLVFERAYSPSDLTLSSHASLFTGVAVRVHGAHANSAASSGWQRLASDRPTLAEKFARRGYGTYAVVANSLMLSSRTGLHRGFGYFDSRYGAAVAVGDRRLPRSRLAAPIEALRRAPPYRRAEDAVDSVEHVLDSAAAGPFFLFVNLMDCHAPYLPPEPFASRYAGGEKRRVDMDVGPWANLRNDVNSRRRALSDDERAFLVSQYDGGIAYQDEQVGRVVERLRRDGLLERTVLVVTADHGEAIGDHGTLTHGVSVYEEQIRVPLLVRAPGLAAGRVTRPISLTGLPEALLALTDGQTEAAVFAAAHEEPIVAESYPDPSLTTLSSRFAAPVRAAVSASAKVIAWEEGGPPQLFDLVRDPRELAPAPAPPAARTLIPSWLAQHPPGIGVPLQVDPDTARKLRALGYIVGPEPAPEK